MMITTDTFLLAAACPISTGHKQRIEILDAGCGSGGLGVLVLERSPVNTKLVGVDIWQEGLSAAPKIDAAEFIQADFLLWDRSDLHNHFNHVISNPPFFSRPSGRKSPDEVREVARGSDDKTSEFWIKTCFKFLKPSGWISLVWPMERLSALLQFVEGRASHYIIVPIKTSAAKSPKRVILLLRKPSKAVRQPDVDYLHPIYFYGEERQAIEEWINRGHSLLSYIRSKGQKLPEALKGTS